MWKINQGEGDHFPAVLIGTFKYCESLEAKVDWDNVLLKALLPIQPLNVLWEDSGT